MKHICKADALKEADVTSGIQPHVYYGEMNPKLRDHAKRDHYKKVELVFTVTDTRRAAAGRRMVPQDNKDNKGVKEQCK